MKTIVGSLWNVSDEATLALMKLFYRKLLKDKLHPIAALRKAQLYIYHNPDTISQIAALRGIDVDQGAATTK